MKKTIFAFFAVTTLSLFVALSLLTISGSTVSAQTGDYAPAGTPSPTTCTNLTTNLGWGTTSADVTTLQNYLSLTGYMSVEATGYYGNVTSNAVSSYQTAHSIEGTGYVGPLTRTAIRNESCGTTASAGTAGTTIAAGSVVCPAGMTCTRATPAATPAVCPLGYVCQPQTGTASTVPTYVPRSIYTPGSAYTPGSLANSASGNQSAGLPAGSMTAAQYQALLQTQGQAAAQAQLQASLQSQLTSTTTPNTAQGNAGSQLDAIIAKVPTSWPVVAPVWGLDVTTGSRPAGYGFYAPAVGQPVKSVCGPNQFYNMLTTPYGCIDNFATNAPIVLNPAVPFDLISGHTITDPYCPGLTAIEGIGSGQRHLTDSTKTGRPTQATEGVMDPVWQQKINCFVGEASRNQPYNNPWVNVNNLFGINEIYLYPPRVNLSAIGTNFCKDAITLTEAKNRNDLQLAAGIHNDLYTSNSRLYVPSTYAPSLDSVERHLQYLDHPGTNKVYWWNGQLALLSGWATSYASFYAPDDIKNADFLALFNAMQFQQTAASNVPIIQRCMDSGYVSNLLPIIGHYQSELIHDKKLGLIK